MAALDESAAGREAVERLVGGRVGGAGKRADELSRQREVRVVDVELGQPRARRSVADPGSPLFASARAARAAISSEPSRSADPRKRQERRVGCGRERVDDLAPCLLLRTGEQRLDRLAASGDCTSAASRSTMGPSWNHCAWGASAYRRSTSRLPRSSFATSSPSDLSATASAASALVVASPANPRISRAVGTRSRCSTHARSSAPGRPSGLTAEFRAPASRGPGGPATRDAATRGR